ncbi:MAG: hypothetical protein HYZ39_04785 [Mycolicibacterium cosmeticum]|nr:hypothetical protein [Mycolicibacterium cosmeticum]
MSEEIAYEISRYDGYAYEQLIERFQVIVEDDRVLSREVDGSTILLPGDLETALRSRVELCEVRHSEMTRIQAKSSVIEVLPLVLRPTGEWGEGDVVIDQYNELRNLPRDVHRQLYVNGAEWGSWMGGVLLPLDDYGIGFTRVWARLGLFESGNMVSASYSSVLGQVAGSRAVAVVAYPEDEGIDDPGEPVILESRSGTAEGDAQILLRWLLSHPITVPAEIERDPITDLMLVELFVENAVKVLAGSSGRGGESLHSEFSYTAKRTPMFADDWGEGGITVWSLYIDLPPDVLEATLALISEHGDEFRDVVVAAREPGSAAARARDARRDAAVFGNEEDES